MLPIHSADTFNMAQWRALNRCKVGNFTTDNGRTYHVQWNKSGTISFKRDTSNVSLWDRFKETCWERPFWHSTIANRFEEKFHAFAKKETRDAYLRTKLKQAHEKAGHVHSKFQPIELYSELDSLLQRSPSYPSDAQDSSHKEQIHQCIQSCRESIANYGKVIGARMATISERLAQLSEELDQPDGPPRDVDSKYREIKKSIDSLEAEIGLIANRTREQRKLIMQFICSLNLASPSIRMYLLPRITELCTTLATYLALPDSPALADDCRLFTQQQTKVGDKLLKAPSCKSSLSNLQGNAKNHLAICGELLTPPISANQGGSPIQYQKRSERLIHLLANDKTNWESIESEMIELADYKKDLATQIAVGEEVGTFLSERVPENNKLQPNLAELNNLKVELDSPGLILESVKQCSSAIELMERMKLGEEVTQFLNEELAGERGKHKLWGSYYNEEMQRRINSLQSIEELCMESDAFDIGWVKEEVEQHKRALIKWNNDHDVFSFKLYGDYEVVRPNSFFGKQHNEVTKLGEEVTQFLNEEIAGERGKHKLWGSYYNEEMQNRINSLESLEDRCQLNPESISDMEWVKEKVEQHKSELVKWNNDHDVFSFKFYADHKVVSPMGEFRPNEKYEEKYQHGMKKVNEVKIQLAKNLLHMQNVFSTVQERKEPLDMLNTKGISLLEASKTFRAATHRLTKGQTFTDQILNLFARFIEKIVNLFVK